MRSANAAPAKNFPFPAALNNGLVLHLTYGPEKNTIQYAADGINFEIMARLKWTPEAIGIVRDLDSEAAPLAALDWDLCHVYRDGWQYIRRFETYLPIAA